MKNQLIVMENGVMTITSIELVKQINIFRYQEENKTILAHKDLLKIIRDEFSSEISEGELSPTSYKDSQGKTRPMYELTTLQAKQLLARESKHVRKALLIYIERLETLIREKSSANWNTARIKGKESRLAETDIIKDKLIPLAIKQGSKNYDKFYMTYSKLVNDQLGINSDMRENLPYHYLATIDMLERIIENIISAEVDTGTHYKEIYQIVKSKCKIAVELSFLPKLNPILAFGSHWNWTLDNKILNTN